MRNLAYRLLSLLIVFMLAGCALAETKSNATATIILSDHEITVTGKGAKVKGSMAEWR